ncbi:hypothetical protein TWF730_002720 [Orbilia blumenaviensis]|uniref:C2H2-type domain-containing protein n=1 Tax=Orbilia blumenaviensis TaxID=1796055 RepID=A0AAV9UBF8_9PEZI
MAYPMECSMSNDSAVSSSMEEDFMLYGTNDDEYFHPLDISGPFPGEEGFSMFTDLANTSSIEEVDLASILNTDFFKLPASTNRESRILGLNDPLPVSHTGFTYSGYLDRQHLGENSGYPTPPSTISSPYSPPINNVGNFPPPRPRRQSKSSHRRGSALISSPPSSPLPPGASSPTGGKSGIFTCPKCSAVFTFKTNKTRHVNSRACEDKRSTPASEGGCTKEYPCPIEGCPTVIKRRKDNLAVHLKKIHGLRMEVARQSI